MYTYWILWPPSHVCLFRKSSPRVYSYRIYPGYSPNEPRPLTRITPTVRRAYLSRRIDMCIIIVRFVRCSRNNRSHIAYVGTSCMTCIMLLFISVSVRCRLMFFSNTII